MVLPFLDRQRELARIDRALAEGGAFICVYGRRRLGKSRLLNEALRERPHAYFVGDDRDAPLQRDALAREISVLIEGFSEVRYDGWESLLSRWLRDAPDSSVLAIDEFPSLVRMSPELPSLLQKELGRRRRPDLSLILCGSSQRMMHGLVLDATAPLYGRATEILRIEPLPAGWIEDAFDLKKAADVVLQYATWGGVPRYWELAVRYDSHEQALVDLALDPLGVLHREPERLLLDETQDIARPASVLSLVARGCHRLSEIASRIGVPATSLARVLARLVDLGLLRKDVPFGEDERTSKRGLYRIADPYLCFFFQCVEPNRSRLAAGQLDHVLVGVRQRLPQLVGRAWEELARASVLHLELFDTRWAGARSWWGRTREGLVEIDLVAEDVHDSSRVLIGEAKRTASAKEVPRLLSELRRRAALCPALQGRRVEPVLWILEGARAAEHVVTGRQALRVLR